MISNLKAVSWQAASNNLENPYNFSRKALVVDGGGNKFSSFTAQSTCALRLSIALYLAGAHFRPVKNSWYFQDGGPKGKKVLLPTVAKDYYELLPGRTEIKGTIDEQRRHLAGKVGIIFFQTTGTSLTEKERQEQGQASGHVTLWDGDGGVGEDREQSWNDEYFADGVSSFFWSMKH